MKKILAIIKICRPVNIFITFLVVIVSSIICSDQFFISEKIIYAAISASLILASGNIINDIFDFKIDSINKPFRPLPSNDLSISNAIILYIILTAFGIILSHLISPTAFLIAISTVLILLFYSYILKRIPIFGNISVAVCTGLAFIYGGVAVNNWEAAIIPAIFGFLVNLIREIVKDVEDLKGDIENKVTTFPAKFGLKITRTILVVLIIVLIVATFYPFISELYTIEYFLAVLFTVDLIMIFILKKLFLENYNYKIVQISNLLKVSMVLGLIAIYLGKY